MKYSYIEAVQVVYSEKELGKLIEFFQTDLGKLYIEEDQSMKMKLGDISQAYVKKAMVRIRKIEENMKSELEKN